MSLVLNENMVGCYSKLCTLTPPSLPNLKKPSVFNYLVRKINNIDIKQ